MSTRRGLIGAAIAAPIRLLLGDEAKARKEDRLVWWSLSGDVDREELRITDRFGGEVRIPERFARNLQEHIDFQLELNAFYRGVNATSRQTIPYRQ